MIRIVQRGVALAAVCLSLLLLHAAPGFAADTLSWQRSPDRVSADIKSAHLFTVLERIASLTGWHVYVEADTAHTVSAKFKDLPPNEALRFLLGDVNFMVLPGTNASPELYVFHTSMHKATQLIKPPPQPTERAAQAKAIPNELIVRLKPGAKIEDIAKLVGAKVIGHIDGLNAYRLQFDDAAAADAARQQLAGNSQVAAVDSNFSMGPPPTAMQGIPTSVPPPQLQLNPPPDSNCRVIVGLVDTGIQSLGKELDPFVMKGTSVAGQSQLDPNSPSHATSMAETILRGVQTATQGKTSVQILPVNVYGPNSTTSTFDVASGIAQAVNGGARVVNLSLGSDGESPFLHSVIQDAYSKNILFIGAAGNTPVTTPYYPAAYPEVNAVTAIDNGQLAPYANRGSFVTLGAPGSSIVNFDNQSWYVAGTSASAAFTSGIAAAYLEANPCATPESSQAFLRKNLGVSITSAPPASGP